MHSRGASSAEDREDFLEEEAPERLSSEGPTYFNAAWSK